MFELWLTDHGPYARFDSLQEAHDFLAQISCLLYETWYHAAIYAPRE